MKREIGNKSMTCMRFSVCDILAAYGNAMGTRKGGAAWRWIRCATACRPSRAGWNS